MLSNEDKPGLWPGIWEYRVALSLCWLRLISYVCGQLDCFYVCLRVLVFVVGFDQTVKVASAVDMHKSINVSKVLSYVHV